MRKWLWLLLLPLVVMGEEITVQSDDLYYNKETIHLVGHVRVENSMGWITAEKAVLTRDESGSTKIDFPWIELDRAVTFTLSNGGKLTCDHVFLDHTQFTSHLEGNVHYFDQLGHAVAEEAYIDYIEKEGSYAPACVRLLKHVQLVNQETSQYALADSVTYYPEEQMMFLESKEHRVLFFDKEQDMQLSAFKVRAERNPLTQKETVQGIGDVRFVFGQEEMKKLKEQFKW